ncbi:MAG TPA: ribonuclease III domain-containing protein [Tepidiformaceae bacterium]|nr:ribonuclease III domain-containing protein [Tepidiformaceae bacterium]
MALATSTDIHDLGASLGVRPLPDDLLGQALTHASFLNEAESDAVSNERLEFLGDSVLGMVIASVLFEAFPGAGEGELTRMRADVVRGTSLARVAARVGLGEHMVLMAIAPPKRSPADSSSRRSSRSAAKAPSSMPRARSSISSRPAGTNRQNM